MLIAEIPMTRQLRAKCHMARSDFATLFISLFICHQLKKQTITICMSHIIINKTVQKIVKKQ